jgi:hypothetical protein
VVDTDVWLRYATGAFALVLIPFGLSPLTVVALLAAVLAAQVVFELARHETHTHPAAI